MFDQRLRRSVLISTGNPGQRGFSTLLSTGLPVGAIAERVLVIEHPMQFHRMPEGASRLRAVFTVTDLRSGLVFPVAEFPGQAVYLTLDPEYSRLLDVIPLSVTPRAAAGRNEWFVVEGTSPEILTFDLEGNLTRVARVIEEPDPIGVDEFRAASARELIRYSGSRLEAQMRAAYARMPIPDSRPIFQNVLVDDLEWLWAELYRAADETAALWMIFDPDGKAQGVLPLPPGLEVHQIGVDFIVGRWRDSSGVEYVRRHTLRR